MRTISIILLATSLSLAAAACGKKDGDKAVAKTTDKADKPAGSAATDPKTLWADFHGGVKGMDLLNKYHDPVAITGTVVKNGPLTFLDVDGTNRIGLDFTDPNAAAKLTAGSTATVTCKIAGTGGDESKTLHTSDCTM